MGQYIFRNRWQDSDDIEVAVLFGGRTKFGGAELKGRRIIIRAFGGEFDSVVSMYHDQGQIATKLHGFHRGVTITAGLATVFTTPAHGTAFDIVGKGIAKTGALENALQLAARIASRATAKPA